MGNSVPFDLSVYNEAAGQMENTDKPNQSPPSKHERIIFAQHRMTKRVAGGHLLKGSSTVTPGYIQVATVTTSAHYQIRQLRPSAGQK